MIHRRGGKRIRMDDPVPPEYEAAVIDSGENFDGDGADSSLDSHSSHDFQDPVTDTTMTPTNMRITRNTRARLSGGPIQQPKYKEIDEDFVPPAPVTSKPKGGGRGRPKRNQQTLNLNDERSLFHAVFNSRSSLTEEVDGWIEKYKTDKESALVKVMQFFIDSSGCKGVITPEMQELEHVQIIRKMTEEFHEDSGDYPLISSGQQWKRFRSNFCEFVQVLVRQCQYSIIYDQFLMDNVISLLTGLSDSQVRAFRHTATLAAMKLMTALVDVALTVSVNLDNTQRQYEAERQKNRENRAADRLDNLMEKRKELEENMDEIKNMLTYMFKSVFIHRYRDILPEIRAICMTEIGIWMKKFPQNFLDDSYLKYIGWTLYDKVGEVRLKCLQALQPLYASEELATKLELFTSKFKERIAAMILDKEYDVAVEAIKLMISIYKYQRELLADEDCEHVYELVFSSHRAVAQAAGEFVNERFFTTTKEIEVKTKRGKKRSPNTPFIRDLILFFIESELHEHAAYLVDSLIETNQMMKDWECMTDLLLEEPGPHEEPLDNQQETSLIEIMIWCIKQSATGEAPIGRGTSRKIISAKEAKQIQDDKLRLTEHFIQVLPLLLNKYRADPEKLANLLCIPQYFELDIYTKSRQEQNLELLLNNIHDIVEISHNVEVLDTAAKTLEYMCVPGSAIFTRCDVAKSKLIDAIVFKYNNSVSEFKYAMDGDEQPDEDEIFAAVESLKKIAIFYSCHDMNSCDIWESLFNDIKETRYKLPDEAVKYCISACFFSILWSQKHLIESADSDRRSEEKCQSLKCRLLQFIECMCSFVKNEEDISPVLREEAYKSICDLLIMFCNQLATQKNPLLHQLIYAADENMVQMLNNFVQQHVFSSDEENDQDEMSQIEEVHKKRNLLAAYCKLIVYNIIPTKAAADIFKHYVKFYVHYGDIIKTTISKTRDVNKTTCAVTMQQSLNTLYNDIIIKDGKVNRNSDEFVAIKELAKRFALSFGLDAVKNREAMTALHRQGILFAVVVQDDSEADPTGPPPNLSYLEILCEFTNKLLKQDKKVVLSFLDKHLQAGMPSSRGEDWQPYLLYRNSLLHGDTETAPVTSKRAYTRRRKDHIAEEEEADEGDDSSDHDLGY